MYSFGDGHICVNECENVEGKCFELYGFGVGYICVNECENVGGKYFELYSFGDGYICVNECENVEGKCFVGEYNIVDGFELGLCDRILSVGACCVEGVVHQSLGFSFWWDIFVVSHIIVLER